MTHFASSTKLVLGTCRTTTNRTFFLIYNFTKDAAVNHLCQENILLNVAVFCEMSMALIAPQTVSHGVVN